MLDGTSGASARFRLFSFRPFCSSCRAELAEVVIGDAVQTPLAVTFEPHHEARRAAGKPHQRVRESLLVPLAHAQMLGALSILDHELVRRAHARRFGKFGLFARIDELQIEVGLRTTVRPHAFFDQLVHVPCPRRLARVRKPLP